MVQVNEVIDLRLRLPRRQPRRWLFLVGRSHRPADDRDVQVVDIRVYRERRRPRLPVLSAAGTPRGGDVA